MSHAHTTQQTDLPVKDDPLLARDVAEAEELLAEYGPIDDTNESADPEGKALRAALAGNDEVALDRAAYAARVVMGYYCLECDSRFDDGEAHPHSYCSRVCQRLGRAD